MIKDNDKICNFFGQKTHPVFCEPRIQQNLLSCCIVTALCRTTSANFLKTFDEKAIMKLSFKKPLANLKT
jgi:hypothetical protein